MPGNSFFKFLLGFAVLIGLGIAGAIFAESYSNGGGDIKELIANFFR